MLPLPEGEEIESIEYMDNEIIPELIREAVEYVQRDAFTEEELQYYEQYRDSVRIEKVALEEERRQKEEAIKRAKEAKDREAEEHRQKEEAHQSLKIMIEALQKSGKTVLEIAALLDKPEKEIQAILVEY